MYMTFVRFSRFSLKTAPKRDTMFQRGDEDMEKEYEQIEYRKILHLNLFFNRIRYRCVHFHNEVELLCLLRGECAVVIPERTITASEGDVILINHGTAHEIRSGAGADFVVVQFSRHTLMDYFPPIRTTFFEKPGLTDGWTENQRARLWGHIYDLAQSYLSASFLAPLYCTAALSSLIAFLYEQCPYVVYSQEQYDNKKWAEQRLRRIVDRIGEDFRNKLLLEEIAGEEGVTPTHLSHFFHEHMGVSFRGYLNNLRFENALRMLADDRLGIVEIAAASGFSDVKYMTKLFKERFGLTPAAYRKSPQPSVRRVEDWNEHRYSDEESCEMIESVVKPMTVCSRKE